MPQASTNNLLTIHDMDLQYLSWQSEGFEAAARALYPFFSRHADHRYSDMTLRTLADVHPLLEGNRDRDTDVLHRTMPVIAVASIPHSYDPDTEMKIGGTTGILALWPDKGWKAVLAVHRKARRIGVASALWNLSNYRIQNGNFWVHRSNLDGQHWLLSQGLFPTAMNSNGSIRYSLREEDE